MPCYRVSSIVMTVGIVAWSAGSVRSQEFRISTEVSINNVKTVSENLTLFAGGNVYDFILSDPKEIAIFDVARQQFELLNVAKRQRLSLSKDEILKFIAQLKASDLARREPFLFEPRFDVSFDAENDGLTLSSERMTYVVDGIRPKEPAVLVRWKAFADWYARLNSTIPGQVPPFARLQLNQQLASRDMIPQRVELTIHPLRPVLRKPMQVTSRHRVIWQLSNTDRKKIDQANQFLVQFKQVGFKEYRGLTAVAAKQR